MAKSPEFRAYAAAAHALAADIRTAAADADPDTFHDADAFASSIESAARALVATYQPNDDSGRAAAVDEYVATLRHPYFKRILGN